MQQVLFDKGRQERSRDEDGSSWWWIWGSVLYLNGHRTHLGLRALLFLRKVVVFSHDHWTLHPSSRDFEVTLLTLSLVREWLSSRVLYSHLLVILLMKLFLNSLLFLLDSFLLLSQMTLFLVLLSFPFSKSLTSLFSCYSVSSSICHHLLLCNLITDFDNKLFFGEEEQTSDP